MKFNRVITLLAVLVGLGFGWSGIEAQPNTEANWQQANGGKVATDKVLWHVSDTTYAGSSRPKWADSTVVSNTLSDTSRWYSIAGLRAASLYINSTARAGAGADSTNLTFTFQTTPDTGVGSAYVKSIANTFTHAGVGTTALTDGWVIYTDTGADSSAFVRSGRWGRLIVTQGLAVGSADTAEVEVLLNRVFEPDPGD